LLYEIVYPIIGINWHMSLIYGLFMWKNIKLKLILASYFLWPTRKEKWIKNECMFVFLNCWIFVLLYYCNFHVHLPPIQVYALIDPEASYFFVAPQKREMNKIWIYVCLFKLLDIYTPSFLYFYFTKFFGTTKIFLV
jgi:hypothetical protein